VRPSCKLTPAQVAEIRASTETLAALAARFGINRGAIWNVRQGLTYKDLAT